MEIRSHVCICGAIPWARYANVKICIQISLVWHKINPQTAKILLITRSIGGSRGNWIERVEKGPRCYSNGTLRVESGVGCHICLSHPYGSTHNFGTGCVSKIYTIAVKKKSTFERLFFYYILRFKIATSK